MRRFVSEMWAEHGLDLVDVLMHSEYRADGGLAGRELVRRYIARIQLGVLPMDF